MTNFATRHIPNQPAARNLLAGFGLKDILCHFSPSKSKRSEYILPADLVVLSACETGVGKNVQGEGLVGLTRGLMYAGTQRVAVSLWDVDDIATAELMQEFYKQMLQLHKSPTTALRAAQLKLCQNPNRNLPFYWAAFTLQGEWR